MMKITPEIKTIGCENDSRKFNNNGRFKIISGLK